MSRDEWTGSKFVCNAIDTKHRILIALKDFDLLPWAENKKKLLLLSSKILDMLSEEKEELQSLKYSLYQEYIHLLKLSDPCLQALREIFRLNSYSQVGLKRIERFNDNYRVLLFDLLLESFERMDSFDDTRKISIEVFEGMKSVSKELEVFLYDYDEKLIVTNFAKENNEVILYFLDLIITDLSFLSNEVKDNQNHFEKYSYLALK